MSTASKATPNILLIMPDQMRGDCLSLERHPVVLTPNMDEIGGKGAHFTRAYTSCASCIPARRSLLTGQFPPTNGMVGFQGGCPITAPTLPQCLRSAGYRTALIGRNMHQSPSNESYGYDTRILGSTYVQNDEYGRFLDRMAPESGGVAGHGISANGWAAKPWHLPEYCHPTNWVINRSRQFLAESQGNEPLFLTSSFYAPHPPLIPPPFYMQRYLRMDLPPAAIGQWAVSPPNDGLGSGTDAHHCVLNGEALRSAQAGYFGLINHLDDQISMLIGDFKAKSVRDGRPWMIIFTSDHGEMLGDHYYFRKCEPYEGSSRIPFLIQGSAELDFAGGLISEQPVALEDIMPTCLELAQAAIPETVDGVSLVSLLRGERQPLRDVLHAEHAPCYDADQAYHMLTDGHLKYIWRPLDGTEQLFDIDSDPSELQDLAGTDKFSDELGRWRSRLVERLVDRPEGFTDGVTLLSGREYDAILPHARPR